MTVGFAAARSMDAFQTESFTLHCMAGIHASLSRQGYGLLFRPCATLAEELDTYRDWARRKRVDGVILVDLLADDPGPGSFMTWGCRPSWQEARIRTTTCPPCQSMTPRP